MGARMCGGIRWKEFQSLSPSAVINIVGIVIIKINRLENGCAVLTQTSDLDGNIAWLTALDGSLVPEPEANAYIERQVARDTDLWVVEVEDREGRCLFDGKIL